MNPKIKQKISIFIYLLLTALLLSGVLFLSSHYIRDNTAPVTQTASVMPAAAESDNISETIETIETAEDTVPDGSETDGIITVTQTEAMERPKPETTDTELPERITAEDVQSETEDASLEPLTAENDILQEEPTDPAEKLMLLLDKRAPLRWARVYSVNEEGETVSEFRKVYPKLAYFYLDLETGVTVTYNADEILYSASLIKAPYVYTILEEIDNFEKTKLPQTDEADSNGAQPETDILVIPGTDEIPETDKTEETMPDETESSETGSGIIYLEGEEKYNLDEIWTFDPAEMMEEGSGEIMNMPAGTQMTWRELVEYTLLYSDNIAFAQLRDRFGYTSFYTKAAELGIRGAATGFMNLSARDCAVFLEEMYAYFETGSKNAEMMRSCMTESKPLEMIAAHYPEGTAAHKYGWDIGAFHDMAIIYDEHPYVLVIMTDYEDGGDEPIAFMGEVVALTKEIHASIHPEEEGSETETAEPESDETFSGETSR